MTADHPTREERYAAVLEVHMGCGPGEILTETVGADTDGGPGEIAVGQTCCSSAHNYAYWNGTCQFASNLAAALVAADPATEALDAETLVDWFDRHQPVVSLDGRVVGCSCMDRVFVRRVEDYSRHLAEVVLAAVPAPEVSRGVAEVNIIQRIVNAWDCCATCAGGVLARHDREVKAEALREVAGQWSEALRPLTDQQRQAVRDWLRDRADRLVRDALGGERGEG